MNSYFLKPFYRMSNPRLIGKLVCLYISKRPVSWIRSSNEIRSVLVKLNYSFTGSAHSMSRRLSPCTDLMLHSYVECLNKSVKSEFNHEIYDFVFDTGILISLLSRQAKTMCRLRHSIITLLGTADIFALFDKIFNHN